MKIEKRIFPAMEELNRSAAGLILQSALAGVADRGVFHLVLSGGNTPRGLYRKLAGPPYDRQTPWKQIQVWWGDERKVPQDHPDSNYRMARETLLSKVPIPPANIHPASVGAEAYQREIGRVDLDLVLLGMGPDGHTASLFPGTALDPDRLVIEVDPPRASPAVPRISLTPKAINRARQALMLIAGEPKVRMANQILKNPQAFAHRYPAAQILAQERTLWLIHHPG